MNTPRSKKLPPRTHLPDELTAEVLSWLPVKSLMRLSSVCKSWNKLITSDQTFIKSHLDRSALRNPQLLLECEDSNHHPHRGFCVTQVSGLAGADPWISLAHNPRHRLREYFDSYDVVGSCNGLICLEVFPYRASVGHGWVHIWNPATGLMSERLVSFCYGRRYFRYKMNFCYDNSTNTYKVVYFRIDKTDRASHVQIFTLGGGSNGWRDIQNFPLLPFSYDDSGVNDGAHLSGTINWMASRRDESAPHYNPETITVEQLVILSLDLGTETYTLLLPPKGLDQVPCVLPRVWVFMDCLCFSHDSNKTHFVIWQMNKFGDAESWVQILKISYQDIPMRRLSPFTHHKECFLHPLSYAYRLFYNGDTLVLAVGRQAILYNRSSNTFEQPTTTNREFCRYKFSWYLALDYVESLVSLY
ncbi:F-box/kelch-repeat protein At3g23880-like [Lotus japonicus]|uniref:F-box/kelch-repeat protein At3g23880-like n=1 Tax=Lotus japonicus TaxID=34305 RepID=UPI002587907C|nr:F-box/kelch-repeat protein At3g23880-like [Lotus japonicus]